MSAGSKAGELEGGEVPGVFQEGKLPVLAGEEDHLPLFGQLREQLHGDGQVMVVEGQQGVVQDQGGGLPWGEEQLGHRQAQG